MHGGPVWTGERIERLKTLWADGLSAADIAAELGGVTRSAVLSKVHRLDLCARASRAPRSHYGPRDAPAALPQRVEPAPVVAAPVGQRCTLMTLTADTCRWPCGEPDHPDFFFCGRRTAGRLPYCVGHARLAYVPAAALMSGKRCAAAWQPHGKP